jgi:uncharacterized protein with PQ loop repeat
MNPAAKRAARAKRLNDVALAFVLLVGFLLFSWLVLGYLVHLATMFESLQWFAV